MAKTSQMTTEMDEQATAQSDTTAPSVENAWGVAMTEEGLPPILQGRNNTTQQVSFLRTRIKHSDPGLTTKIGVLPRGAFIKRIMVYTITDFEDVTATLGKEPYGDDYGDIDLLQTINGDMYIPMEERDVSLDAEKTIYMTRDKQSSTGEAEVIVEFYTNC
ncbi:hypothetical protein [Bartonella saheliensis]|uniref:hypothetical protein n=1 Tax=Bartonella saheliensis TaxID=1457016 RepID=UPI00119EC9BA|nr:hypothetical protein [Bartonella saheliensis]